jgi:L-ascorbate metabolism protein UlaG (beta-lactamase superfamily)
MMLQGSLIGTLRQQFEKGVERRPINPLPLAWPGRSTFDTPPASGLRVTWMGHSSMLIEIGGITMLVDPVWSKRASPTQFAGPLRFHAPPAPLAEIPIPDIVLLTHDHFDHLDEPTIRTLARGSSRFVAPLGLGRTLERWGITADRIDELDWWEELTIPGTDCTLVALPARHYSGRSLFRRSRSLWASWAIMTPGHRVFMGCDSGPYAGMAEFGEKLGPFDLAIMPIGQYGSAWPDIHVTPEQALEEFHMLRARALLPIHWGTFPLAFHPWHEPIERLIMASSGETILTPRLGEPIEPTEGERGSGWWRSVAVARITPPS